MNRRSFMANLIAGAAAVLGCGMVAPKAEASAAEEAAELPPMLDLWGRSNVTITNCTVTGTSTAGINLGPGTYLAPIEPTWRGSIVGAGIDQPAIMHAPSTADREADA